MIKLRRGDCRKVLARMPAGSVQCVVTSPPYFGLRDYGVAGQIGLEATPDEFVAAMVRVFREVRRVLRDDGTCFINLGDSYNSGTQNNHGKGGGMEHGHLAPKEGWAGHRPMIPGLKLKDLIGIPWRVALALQADGWYLRSDIIWHKPNPMPESVTDRPTKSHEYLFLLTKRERYYFDGEAVRESAEYGRRSNFRGGGAYLNQDAGHGNGQRNAESTTTKGADPKSGRNIRSVWTIPTQPYKGAHFATFPRRLVEPCVKAGTSERGCCPKCGAPWERDTERGEQVEAGHPRGENAARCEHRAVNGASIKKWTTKHLGWRPTCECRHIAPISPPIPCTVLDPFAGAGTVGVVCDRLGRDHVGIDLNPEYLAMARRRIAAERRKWTTTPANA